jgi:hypothetical protein
MFVLGLRTWNTDDRRMKILLNVAQIMGILSAFFLILAAIFPLGSHSPQHSFWSGMLSVAMGFFLTFSATALLKHPVFRKWIAYYAFLSALVNFIYGMSEAIGHEFFIGEWVSIGMFIIYIVLIAYNYKIITSRRR